MFVNKQPSTPRGRSPTDDFSVEFDEETRSGRFFNCVSHTIIDYPLVFSVDLEAEGTAGFFIKRNSLHCKGKNYEDKSNKSNHTIIEAPFYFSIILGLGRSPAKSYYEIGLLLACLSMNLRAPQGVAVQPIISPSSVTKKPAPIEDFSIV